MKKILLAVNCEYGQANVFLAVAHSLQALDPDVQIHIASFAPIASDVLSASEYSKQCTQGARPWHFHLLDGPFFQQAIAALKGTERLGEALLKSPNFFSTIEVLSWVMNLMLPWNGPEFVQIYKSFVRVVDDVQPDIIVVDSLLSPVLTACRHLKFKHLVLSPNTLKDFATALQPNGAMFWKFPVMSSALPFPIPLHLIPLNILFSLFQIFYALTDRTSRTTAEHIRQSLDADLVTFETLMFRPLPGQHILVANRPEIDFPLEIIPEHLTPCGPVIRPVPSVGEVDAELEGWLRRGPTVFLSLGTHRVMGEGEAVEMAGAVRMLLDAAQGVMEGLQVFWKLKKDRGTGESYGIGEGSRVYGVIGRELEADRVKIVEWVKPQPSAVLKAGTVVCSVNHGGANSFHDALTSGVPQVVLPSWLDCYDFASRAEVLGIGRWGNKQAMPRCTGRELGPILVDVVLGPKAQAMRTRAQDLADLCAKTPGASVAAKAILDEMDDRKRK